MKLLCQFSPPFVLFTWAGLLTFGCEGLLITATGLVLLVVALAFHVREQHHV